MVVTATGMQTEMGRIADDADVGHTDPVAVAAGARLADQGPRDHRLDRGRVHRRGRAGSAACRSEELFLLGTAMAISAIPTGLPAFVSGLLSFGAKQLADAKAIVKNLTDVETLGRDERDQHRQDRHADDERDDGLGHLRRRRLVHRRGRGLPQDRARSRRSPATPVPDFTRLALGHGPRQRRHGRRRRRRRRRPDRGGAGRAGRQARRGRRGDPARLPAPGRGALRLRLQVHGDVPPGRARRRASAWSSWSRAAPTSCWRAAPVRRPDERHRRSRSRRPAPTSTPPTSGWASRGCGCSPSRRGSSRTTSSTR